MARLSAFLLTAALLCSGCIQSDEDAKVTLPTESQVSQCITKMHLNPQIKITPLGFKLEDSGPDDAIWFKFKTDTTNLQEIFDTQIVNASDLENNFTFIYAMDNLAWWDVQNKAFLGGQISLPNGEFMNIGIEQDSVNHHATIYIMWHET